MVETRNSTAMGRIGVRPEETGPRPRPEAPAGPGKGTRPFRQRIPTPRQLASLLVDGVLALPANYRRGMFLDVLV